MKSINVSLKDALLSVFCICEWVIKALFHLCTFLITSWPFPSSPQCWSVRGEKALILWDYIANSTTRLGNGHLEALKKGCELPPHFPHPLSPNFLTGFISAVHTSTLLWITKEKKQVRARRFLKVEMLYIWGFLSHSL